MGSGEVDGLEWGTHGCVFLQKAEEMTRKMREEQVKQRLPAAFASRKGYEKAQ